MPRLSTAPLLAGLLDDGSWEDWVSPKGEVETDTPVRYDSGYVEALAEARLASGVSESITVGAGRIGGSPVVVIASEFDFLAGSIGRDAARRIIAAFDEATAQGRPVIGLPTSGGTRMQEGTPTFLRMAAIAAAVQRHKDAGLPYLVYLRHPTTGGVFASWGSLGDVTFGEPGALTGFLGPRVYEGLFGEPFPDGVQSSEGLADAGVIDGVAAPDEWRSIVVSLLDVWAERPSLQPQLADLKWPADGRLAQDPALDDEVLAFRHDEDPWESVLRTRELQRSGVRELVDLAAEAVLLSGDQAGSQAQATILAVAKFKGAGCVLVGQDRSAQLAGQLIGPTDLRVARRGMRLAERWGLPLVTVIDTQGGELSVAAERGGLAGEIARCLADLSSLEVPTISVLLGGGGGGVALALLPADRVLAVADSWVTPLPPEGASLIRHRTTKRADEMARAQSITAGDLQAAGAVDRILPRLEIVHSQGADAELSDGSGALKGVSEAIGMELREVSARPTDVAARATRWSAVG